MSAGRIRISEGNRKLGMIASVSLPAVKACGKNIPCARTCYVVKNMYSGPWRKSIMASHQANYDLLLADRDDFFAQLAGWISKHAPKMFRYHVSGDWIDSDHMHRAFELARATPGTKYLAFTKRHDLLPPVSRIPENFSMVASMWTNWNSKPPRGYRRAWYQDGFETRVPRTALHCPGNCETCGMCWTIYKIGRDVYFNAH
jgi:hypothetical protein